MGLGTEEQLDIYRRILSELMALKTSDILQLKRIWEKNYEDFKILKSSDHLSNSLVATKDYFKKLCLEGKMEDFQKARDNYSTTKEDL